MIFFRFMSAVTLPAMLVLSGCGGESATINSTTGAITPDNSSKVESGTTATATPVAAPSPQGFAAPTYTTKKRNLQRRACSLGSLSAVS